MISSGMKRGLAATAVSALAVAGLPFLASSASAAGSLSVISAGNARNGGTIGGTVVLLANGNGFTNGQNVLSLLKPIGSDLSSPATTPSQTVVVNDATAIVQGANTAIVAHVSVTTPTDGATANYALFLDNSNPGVVDADEPRAQISQTTAGAPASVAVTPAEQNSIANVLSGRYTATITDAGGRTTQLTGAETATLASDGGGATSFKWYDKSTSQTGTETTYSAALPAAALASGSLDFAAADTSTAAVTRTLTATIGGKSATAKLNIAKSATGIAPANVDLVTGADNWDGPGTGAFPKTAKVRVDQTSLTLNIVDTANKGATVLLTATPASGATVDGAAAAKTFTTTLDADGKGSVTIPVTAVVGSSVAITGNGVDLTAQFEKAAVTSVALDAGTYVSAYGGSVDVTATAVDQFGLPAASGTEIGIQRLNGANADTAVTRKAVDANGQATFTLTDTKATAASHVTDDISVSAYADQYVPVGSPTVAAADKGDIVYTADGKGGDFGVSVDGTSTASPSYSPTGAYATINPLTSGKEDGATSSAGNDDDVQIAVTGGTGTSSATISVDNGALIVPTGGYLADGSDSKTVNLSGGAATFTVVGTKTGTVTATITSAGVTKTAQFTVKSAASASGTARNIAVSGPAKAKANDVVTFTAVVTDAFGNPVAGVSAPTATLTGPASLLGTPTASNAAGQITYQAQLTNSAASAVTLSLTATGAQFGAAANRLTAASTTDDAKGLTASSNTASATIADVVNIAALQAAVDAAQAKVDGAEDSLADAQGALTVAQTEQSVAKEAKADAQKDVKKAKKDLKKAKKAKKNKAQKVKAAKAKVAAAKKELKAAKGDVKVANAKVKAAQGKVDTAQTRLADAQAELEAAEQALADAQS